MTEKTTCKDQGAASKHSETGFVLVATLVAIAIITLGAAYFAAQVDTLRNSALYMQRWAETEREAFVIRESLQFAAATGVRDEGGLTFGKETLATDGRRYKLTDTLSITVQDERGLLAINTLDEKTLLRLLDSFGIPVENQPRLIDSLLDYIDADDLKRLNGAEKAEYARMNKLPPTNDFLRTRQQLQEVASWDDLFNRLRSVGQTNNPGVESRFIDLFSTSRHSGLNLNSAPAAVLYVVPGLDRTKISALIDQRRARAFTSIAQLAPFTTGPIDSDYLSLFGANDLRVVLYKAELPFLLECQLSITPGDTDRPTRLKMCVRRPINAGAGGGSDEFQRALLQDTQKPDVRQQSGSRPLATTSPSIRNDLRDAPQNVDAKTPQWLAEVLNPDKSPR
ncbi:MAG: general secretion pathway protein GspK [Burkholderiales bacterium]|nr:general secretion pathway protein GspK [Betaproteobacteria bacterium]